MGSLNHHFSRLLTKHREVNPGMVRNGHGLSWEVTGAIEDE